MKTIASLLVLLAIASTASAQTVGTCRIFPPNNPWNTRIDTLPVHPRSQQYINSVGASIHLHPDFGSNPDYGIPWIAVGANQPFVNINVTSGWGEEDPGPYPVPANAKVEGNGIGDAHVLVVDTADHHLYELYQGVKDATGSGWSCTTSAKFALDSNNFRPDGWTSCDAAGLPIFPGLVRKDECDAGEIKHALRFTIQKSSKGYIFPARHYASSNTDTANVMPMGMRLRLKASYDDSKLSGNAKVIATAMKRYGIIMADNGSNWFVTGENNTSWDDNNISQLKAITGNDFEVVYSGPIRIRPNQYPDPDLSQPSGGSGGALVIRSVDFKSLHVGEHRDSAIFFINTGTSPITITNISVVESPAFNLTSSTKAVTLQPGKFVVSPVRFTPPAPGVYYDTITITTDESSNNIYAGFAKGIGIGDVLKITPSSLSVVADLSDTTYNSLALTNTGTSPLTILSDSLSSPSNAFHKTSWTSPKILQPNQTELYGILYTPMVDGPHNATLTISTDEGSNNIHTITLVGTTTVSSRVEKLDKQYIFAIHILPNPAKNLTNIQIDAAIGQTKIEVFDATGRNVLNARTSGSETSLDLRSLPGGEYFIHAMNSAGGTATGRLTVEH
jgi:hypothetical protein